MFNAFLSDVKKGGLSIRRTSSRAFVSSPTKACRPGHSCSINCLLSRSAPSGLLVLLVPVSLNRGSPACPRFPLLRLLNPGTWWRSLCWGVVSMVKLAKMAQIFRGCRLLAHGFIFVMAAATAAVIPRGVGTVGGTPVKSSPHGAQCRSDRLFVVTPVPGELRCTAKAAKCPRCGATLHSRKPDSIARTWALVIAACIFYIPPCPADDHVTSLGMVQSDHMTVSSTSFRALVADRLVIFIASIFVPLLKCSFSATC